MNNNNRIPTNMNNEEESRFWDTHDLLDFIDDTREVEITISPKLKDLMLSRYRERIKEKTFNKYMTNMTTTASIVHRKSYLYIQYKSNVGDNPDANSEKKESHSYSRILANIN